MKDLSVILDFDKIPINYTCDGRNISPKIVILGLDESVKVMAIIIEDIDAPSGTFTHWTIWNLSPMDIVPEGIPNEDIVDYPFEGGVPIRAVQGSNGFGKVGYMGPCPPKGNPHKYVFKVYGLDLALDLKPGSSKRDLEDALRGHILQQGQAVATYQRQEPYGR